MFVLDARQRLTIKKLTALTSFPVTVLALYLSVGAMPPPSSDNCVRAAQRFLQTAYPQLKGRHFTITIITTYAFDIPAPPLRKFGLYVGEGKKDTILGYLGGYPKDAPPPPPSQLGPIYPKQYLSSGFAFDEDGRLLFFGAEGEDVLNPAIIAPFAEAREHHPEWTEEEAALAMKQNGAKYAPSDKEKLLRELPVDLLEPYLGTLTVESAEFKGLWPKGILEWVVKVKATDRHGRVLRYSLLIEPFKGSLMEIKADTYPES